MVDVSVASVNQGMLKHEYGAPGIPYHMTFNGQQLVLDAPTSVRLSAASAGQEFTPQLLLRVSPSPDAAAGRYTDTLTVTFTAN